MTIPVLDERVKYVGVAALRGLNAKALRSLKDLLVIQVNEKPVAVIIPIAIYMEIQSALWPSSLIPGLAEFFSAGIEISAGTAPTAEEIFGTLHEAPAPFLDKVAVSAIGVDATPRGKRLSIEEERELRDNPPPVVFDDLDGFQEQLEDQQDSAALEADNRADAEKGTEPTCAHCGKPGDKPLCKECFRAGHRSGDCLQCGGIDAVHR